MCGLVVAASFTGPLSDAQIDDARRMSYAMRTRGPDSNGEQSLSNQRVVMAHRRLSIIDTSDTGHQPMQYAGSRYTLVFNGEIYNHHELRTHLQQCGHAFNSTSDTEVILAAYAQYGRSCVEHLRGMFAFALYDAQAHTLLLARDPFGIKPLYTRVVRQDGQTTVWACSQVKPLSHLLPAMETEPAGLVGFYLWGHVPDPWTLHAGVHALPAGHTALINLNAAMTPQHGAPVVSEPYFNLGDCMAQAVDTARQQPVSADQWPTLLRNTLTDSISHHLEADVPVGVLLSGGLDSCTLAALAREDSDQLHTLTLGFREQKQTPQDETGIARIMADYLQTRHHTEHIGQSEFQENFSNLVSVMDQPSIDGVNVYFICQAAARNGLKVVLSGLGGDELFGTYPSFRSIPAWVRTTRPLRWSGTLARKLTAPWIERFSSRKAASLLELGHTFEGAYLLRRGLYLPWELPGILPPEIWQPGLEALDTLAQIRNSHSALSDTRHKISLMEASWYMRNQLLRDADWASMAHSVEVRLPFVDVKLWASLLPWLDSDWLHQKAELATVPAIRLPTAIGARGKSGFAVPVRQWLSGMNWQTGERGARDWARHIIKQTNPTH